MAIKDNHSPAAYLVFNLTFPFMKHDLSQDELDPITDSKLNMYRSAEITMNMLKQEFTKLGIKYPDHYDEAHEHITKQILELKQSKNK